jgi:hypothetical protein
MKIKIKKKELEKMILEETIKLFDNDNAPLLQAVMCIGDLYKESNNEQKKKIETIFEHLEKELMFDKTKKKLKDIFND